MTVIMQEEILSSLSRLTNDVEAMAAAGERNEIYTPNAGTYARIAEAKDILKRAEISRLEAAALSRESAMTA